MTANAPRTRTFPVAAILGAAAIWGTLWIPSRWLDGVGITAGYAPAIIFAAAVVLMLPVAIARRRRLRNLRLWLVASTAGLSAVMYMDALIYGDVARTVLIFYTLPIWTTLAGRLLLGEAITLPRLGAIALSFGGLLVVLSGDGNAAPWPTTWQEWMTLASSVLFALAIVGMRMTSALPDFEKVFVQSLAGAVAAVALAQIPAIAAVGAPAPSAWLDALPWAAVAAAVWVVPSMWMNFWGARWLSPGLVGILMLSEVLFGVVSAALLTDEVMGLNVLIGAVLIVGAGVLDVLSPQRRATPIEP
ncbi:MAG: DMT family transporter [Rhodospirillales bacterium]|nr:DMT family transporter [Rhodospirillales bacterium]